MIEIKGNELDECRKAVLRKQKLIMFYEALMASEEFGGRDTFYFMREDISKGCRCDLSRNLVKNLFEEILDEQITRDFYIDLKDESFVDIAWDLNKKAPENIETKKLLKMAYRLNHSQLLIADVTKSKKIDLIEVMIKTENYDEIIKLVISDKIEDGCKRTIIGRILECSKGKLEKIFNTVPDDYRSSSEEKEEAFKNLVEKNLSLIKGCGVYLEGLAKKSMNADSKDWNDTNSSYMFIKFLIEHNLIDINQINWSYDGTLISSACANYIMRNMDLGDFLYNLSSYKNLDNSIRTNSDIVLINEYIWSEEIVDLFKSVNFEATPEKLGVLEKAILNSQKGNKQKNKHCYCYEHLDDIIDIFLRKTKKENYKKMKNAIVSIKTNTNLELQKEARKRLVITLQNMFTPLAAQAPALANVGDAIKTIQKKNS